ncbi:BrnT family toxin [Thiothrix fructosivorans]|jgi:uncharacterized DUF497 family protein|uniref:BrnT family toxin n=1 Tax=Thiothrix fructosivorans TaxID=111770 RepID=A0A8B0SQW3_9GAMM|nr:BrnT family toxin [Thiothrix fructosivorans]MBO0613271.1 BrnT family toxin [Thiothrix fructosivorans]QTX11292.1 BrnT family toxin [Thiothrix fructosivorans]
MLIRCDPRKDALNIRNHGLSLKEAENLEWDLLKAEEDARFAYGEMRMVGFVPMGMHLFCVVFTDSGEIRRVISLRKATKQELRRYVDQF